MCKSIAHACKEVATTCSKCYLQSDSSSVHHVPNSIKPQPMPYQCIAELPARVRDIATLRGLGYSYREIGERFGTTHQAVSIMLTRHRRSLSSLRDRPDLAGLSARAVNVLGRIGVCSREEASARDVLALLQIQRNCGAKTREEIARWLTAGSIGQSDDSPVIGHFDRNDSVAVEGHPVEA